MVLVLLFLKLSKDVQIVLGSYIIVELFLGGPNGPIFFGWNQFWYTFWFVLKVLIVVIIMEYITNIFARIRIDQAMYINWRMLMPISIILVILSFITAVIRPIIGLGFTLCISIGGGIIFVYILIFVAKTRSKRQSLR